MVNQPLRIQAIQKFIASQEKSIQEYKNEIISLTSRIGELEIGIELFNQSLDEPKRQLESLGGVSLSSIVNIQSSAEQTLKFIDGSSDPMGCQIRDIIEDYKEIGIIMHPRNVIEHLKQLEIANQIYQTNPEIQRGRRYKVADPIFS